MTTEFYQKTFEVSHPANLTVRNRRGQVTITPGSDDRISIKLTKHLGSGNPDLTAVKLVQDQDGAVSVNTEYAQKWLSFINRLCIVDYQITVPAKCNIQVSNVNANLHLEDITGTFRLKSVSGRIETENLTGSLKIKSVSGSIHGIGINAPAEINSVSGNISFDNCNFPKLAASNVSGNTMIQSPLDDGPYTFSSVSGNITFVIPPGTACTIKARSISGRLHTDLPPTRQMVSRRNWDIDLEGGGVPLKLNTVSGSIQVVSSLQSRGVDPGEGNLSTLGTRDILTKLEHGQITVDEAVTKLAP